jgi:hypothetical protein
MDNEVPEATEILTTPKCTNIFTSLQSGDLFKQTRDTKKIFSFSVGFNEHWFSFFLCIIK